MADNKGKPPLIKYPDKVPSSTNDGDHSQILKSTK